jgi:ABC-type nitrate/sulfonate/bicarbonate transport system substrate-binding protein
MIEDKGDKKMERSTGRTSTFKIAVFIMAALLRMPLTLGACGGGSSSSDSGSSPAAEADAGAGAEAEADADANEASGETAANVEEEPFVIKLQGIRANKTFLDSATLAIEKGIFAKYGLEVEDIGSLQVGQWVTALQSGTLDFASIMTNEGLTAIDNGAEIISIAGDTDTYFPEKPHMTFLVKKGSPIKTGQDFIGKKLGTPAVNGGCTAGFPIEFMRQAGVEDAINQVNLIAVPETSVVDALLQGEIDIAGTHFIPEVVEKLYGDQLEIVFSDYDILGQSGGDKDWYTTVEFKNEHPDVVRNFVAAISEVNNWINENNEEADEIYRSVAEVNEEIFYLRHYTTDGLVHQDNTQLWIDLLTSPGQVAHLNNITSYEQVSTNEFNEKG